MNSVFAVLSITSICILITMSLALIRAMKGPTVFDRVLALNMFGTKTVLLICVASFMQGRTDFLDLALLYSLMNFIGMVALLRFTTKGDFGPEALGTEALGEEALGDSAS
ncbi:monovalent cation/H+ antiporter complex subunit F [Rubripirellula amarantea]|uniref:Na(+)/H(+) antiporter subunit F n=1 Tax=Rubripirellula amarantea TaxID=2527999 RepID=A0A5C5WDC0_9BACT|nr:monovalent cation/H+ antiporter complex subunit F [Rubripirellula amarantea]TWT48133.1 Na(+)/H(+) antiporter subunit F [Rubripirellula amarantea]